MRRVMRTLDLIIRIVLTVLFIGLLIALLLGDDLGKRTVSRELTPAVESWQRDLTAAGVEWKNRFSLLRSIELADLPPGKAGSSNSFAHSIKISRDLLAEGEYTLQATVYHELGHSAFGLEHGCCVIMQEDNLSETEYQERWPSLLEEYEAECKKSKS